MRQLPRFDPSPLRSKGAAQIHREYSDGSVFEPGSLGGASPPALACFPALTASLPAICICEGGTVLGPMDRGGHKEIAVPARSRRGAKAGYLKSRQQAASGRGIAPAYPALAGKRALIDR